jgi:hypothetical protein
MQITVLGSTEEKVINMNKKERKVIEDIAENLSSFCEFPTCPGRDAPYVPMSTCYVCSAVQELRILLENDKKDRGTSTS